MNTKNGNQALGNKQKKSIKKIIDKSNVKSRYYNLSGYGLELMLTHLILSKVKTKKINLLSDKVLTFEVLESTHNLAKLYEKLSRSIFPNLGLLVDEVITTATVKGSNKEDKGESRNIKACFYAKTVKAGISKSEEYLLQEFISEINSLNKSTIDKDVVSILLKKNFETAKKSFIKTNSKSQDKRTIPTLSSYPINPQTVSAISDIHKLLEMAFIYGSSYVKIGTQTDEISYAIYDYLNAKTFYSMRFGVKVEVLPLDNKAQINKYAQGYAEHNEICIITETCVIRFGLEAKWLGLEVDFVRTVVMNNFLFQSEGISLQKEKTSLQSPLTNSLLLSLKKYKKRYEIVENHLTSLSSTIGNYVTGKTLKLKAFPHTTHYEKFKVEFRLLSDYYFYKIADLQKKTFSKDLSILKKSFEKKLLTKSKQAKYEVFFVRIYDLSSDIIMSNILLIKNDSFMILPEHGNHYLEFPW